MNIGWKFHTNGTITIYDDKDAFHNKPLVTITSPISYTHALRITFEERSRVAEEAYRSYKFKEKLNRCFSDE